MAHNNLGAVLLHLNRIDGAIAAFEKAIALTEARYRADAHYNLGTRLLLDNNLERAIGSFDNALKADPEHSGAYNNLGCALQYKGDAEGAADAYRRAYVAHADYADAYSNRLMTMHYLDSFTNADVLDAALDFGSRFDRPDLAASPAATCRPNANCASAICLRRLQPARLPVLPHPHPGRPRPREIRDFCYYNWSVDDCVTEHIQTLSDHWRVVIGKSDEEAAEMIRADEIDISSTSPATPARPAPWRPKPAPVQVCWLGYFGTTGLGDDGLSRLDPVSCAPGPEVWYREAMVRLPDWRFCYSTPPRLRTGRSAQPGARPCHLRLLQQRRQDRIDLGARLVRDPPRRSRFRARC